MTARSNKTTRPGILPLEPSNPGCMRITGLLDMAPANSLPASGNSVVGVANFHGKTVPVLDFRMNPFAGVVHNAAQICILSAENDQTKALMIFGALVDSQEDAYQLLDGSTH